MSWWLAVALLSVFVFCAVGIYRSLVESLTEADDSANFEGGWGF